MTIVVTTRVTERPDMCPHCGEVRALEPVVGSRVWFCATCAKTFLPPGPA